MIEGTLSSYGGSAQEATDSRNTQESLNQSGAWQVRQERERVVLSSMQTYIVEYHAGGSRNSKEETMTIKDIQMQSDPIRKAAMIHVRFWHTAAWEKAQAMRNDLIDEYDPEWPHGQFWNAVDAIYEPEPSID